MGPTETINYRLSLFFNLSFIGDKWETINDKSIFFIFALFSKIYAILDDFSKSQNIFSTFHFEKWQKFVGKSEEKSCP